MIDSTVITEFIFLSLYRVHLTILSGFTDTWTITLKVQSNSLSHKNSSRPSSATGQVRLSKRRSQRCSLYVLRYI